MTLWQQLLADRPKPQWLPMLKQLIALCTQTHINDDNPRITAVPQQVAELTAKEWQVLQFIGQGYSNEQISAQLFVAVSTVKSHINHIYRKLALRNRIEAKALAVSLQLQNKG